MRILNGEVVETPSYLWHVAQMNSRSFGPEINYKVIWAITDTKGYIETPPYSQICLSKLSELRRKPDKIMPMLSSSCFSEDTFYFSPGSAAQRQPRYPHVIPIGLDCELDLLHIFWGHFTDGPVPLSYD